MCPTVQGGRERRTELQQQPNHTTIVSLSSSIYPTNTLRTFPPTLCYIFPPPFSQQQWHLSLLTNSLKFIQPLSGPHNSAHIIQPHLPIALKFPTTHQEMSYILPNHTFIQLPSLIILQQFSWTSPHPVLTSHILPHLYYLFPTYTISMSFSYILLHPSPHHFLP